jgi:hypothetical protein
MAEVAYRASRHPLRAYNSVWQRVTVLQKWGMTCLYREKWGNLCVLPIRTVTPIRVGPCHNVRSQHVA